MNRFLVLGLPGAVLGALLGVLIIVAQMTGIAGTPGDYATPFEGPLAFKKIELKQVAETRQMPDGRLYTFRKFVSHWVPVSATVQRAPNELDDYQSYSRHANRS